MTDSVVANLIKARKLIEDPAHWIKGMFAMDAKGASPKMPPGDENVWLSPAAKSFCLRGAILRAADYRLPKDHTFPISLIHEEHYVHKAVGMGLATFNNHSSHADVIGAIDSAIHIRKKELGAAK